MADRRFRGKYGDLHWNSFGGVNIGTTFTGVAANDIRRLEEWLRAGPPKCYRIIKVFDQKPTGVEYGMDIGPAYQGILRLEDSDIEEV